MDNGIVLHIFDLGAIVTLVYWLLAHVKEIAALPDDAKTLIGIIIVALVAVVDNVIFYSGNAQLISVVTSLYNIILAAVAAMGVKFGYQQLSNTVKAKYADLKEKRALDNARKLVAVLVDAGLEVTPYTVAALFPDLPEDVRARIRDTQSVRPGAAGERYLQPAA